MHTHACAVFVDGGVRCWGNNAAEQLGLEAGALAPHHGRDTNPVGHIDFINFFSGYLMRSVSVGSDHSCALTSNGETLCWGTNARGNQFGQLGRVWGGSDHEVGECAGCTKLRDAEAIRFSDVTMQVARVEAGHFHTCVLFVSRRALCFGLNEKGQLGTDSDLPVSGLDGAKLDEVDLIMYTERFFFPFFFPFLDF